MQKLSNVLHTGNHRKKESAAFSNKVALPYQAIQSFEENMNYFLHIEEDS